MTEPRFTAIALKTIIVHTLSYTVVGLVASSVVGYGTLFSRPDMALLMRQVTDPLVMAGPLFQPIRGLVFAVVIYLLRDSIFPRTRGWLVLWATLVGLGIVSTFGPAPGSVEGLVYTRIAVGHQLIGLPEVLIQSLLLAAGVFYWVRHPENKWFSRSTVAAFVIAVALPILGLLVTVGGGV